MAKNGIIIPIFVCAWLISEGWSFMQHDSLLWISLFEVFGFLYDPCLLIMVYLNFLTSLKIINFIWLFLCQIWSKFLTKFFSDEQERNCYWCISGYILPTGKCSVIWIKIGLAVLCKKNKIKMYDMIYLMWLSIHL